jgi:hypothetical protein
MKSAMDKENGVYLYTPEYYSAINKNEILSLIRKWMKLELEIII